MQSMRINKRLLILRNAWFTVAIALSESGFAFILVDSSFQALIPRVERVNQVLEQFETVFLVDSTTISNRKLGGGNSVVSFSGKSGRGDRVDVVQSESGVLVISMSDAEIKASKSMNRTSQAQLTSESDVVSYLSPKVLALTKGHTVRLTSNVITSDEIEGGVSSPGKATATYSVFVDGKMFVDRIVGVTFALDVQDKSLHSFVEDLNVPLVDTSGGDGGQAAAMRAAEKLTRATKNRFSGIKPKRGWAYDSNLRKAVLAYRIDVDNTGFVIVAAKDGRLLKKLWPD